MECKYFGECGSCTLYEFDYEKQLDLKVKKIKDSFGIDDLEVIKSPKEAFRYRMEFGIYHEDEDISYAMNSFKKRKLKIDSCQIASSYIKTLMPKLLMIVKQKEILKSKLFGVEFLTTTTDEAIITLLYHKKIDKEWEDEAKESFSSFNANIIGRSRGVKIVLDKDFIHEELLIDNKKYRYRVLDSGFTQPNPAVNIKMIEWVLSHIKKTTDDLLELYCGLGNFTLPLSSRFKKVLATEVSKASIKSAKENIKLNDISNISFARLSSEEFTEAMDGKREFRRLKGIKLDSFNFETIFVDPPRAGVDEKTIKLLKRFDNIIYISCNPDTLKRDLSRLEEYEIKNFALFDQFPYTNHIESGVILQKRSCDENRS